MLDAHLHRAATLLLEAAIRIAPRDTRDWGQAMLGELIFIKRPWSALAWALGGAGVLAKRALVSFFTPGRSTPADALADGLFTKEDAMRKSTLIITGGCILSALLLFAAPSFRQAFQLSLAPWHWVFRFRPADGQSSLRDLARRAEERRDAEGIALCAAQIQDKRDSARWVEEAVRLDPSLTWVYAVVAVRHPELPETSQWIPKLQQWDPQNALFPMIAAESNDILHGDREDVQTRGGPNDPAWVSAMAAAFQSSNLDDYLDRVEVLQGKVLSRYGLHNPDLVLPVWRFEWGFPTYALQDSTLYAKSLIESAKELEAKGDKKGAIAKYWSVARFGQLIDSREHNPDEYWVGAALQSMAYHELQAVSEKDGNHAEAAHFAYLTSMLDRNLKERGRTRWSDSGTDASRWNALVFNLSGLLMLIFTGCVVVAALILIVSGWGREPNDLRAKRRAAAVGLIGGAGLFLSSAMLYVVYHPYAETFNRVLTGDKSRIGDLQSFLGLTHEAPFLSVAWAMFPPQPRRLGRALVFGLGFNTLDFVFYFWVTVIVLGVAGLALVALRRMHGRPRAHAPA